MDKQIVFDMTKKSMVGVISDLSEQNIKEIKKQMMDYFSFLEAMEQLPSSEETPLVALPECRQEKGGRFERKLKGGFIEKSNIYVPESVVRKVGIEHGDYVDVKEIESKEQDENKRYFYDLVRKGEAVQTGRIEMKYGLVEKDGQLLVVRKTILNGGELIRLNDVPYSFLIRDEEVYELGIKEGDIVDIAYMQREPHLYRVIWKHLVEEETVLKSSAKGSSKEKKMSLPKNVDVIVEPNTLKGKQVLVVGCEPRKSAYKQQIEARGGHFYWAEGTEGKKRLKAMVQKTDVVVLLIRFMRHRASQDIVELCKELDVPFTVIDTLGIQSLLHGLIQKTTA